MFSKPEVEKLLNQYTVLQMYTDVIPAKYQPTSWTPERNRDFQFRHFRDVRLPLYAIIEPADNRRGFRKIAVYPEGKINDEAGFQEFLQRHLLPRQ